jgi:hypothetical protein
MGGASCVSFMEAFQCEESLLSLEMEFGVANFIGVIYVFKVEEYNHTVEL